MTTTISSLAIATSDAAENSYYWSFHEIKWRQVIAAQSFGVVLFTIIPITILASILFIANKEPESRLSDSFITANPIYALDKKDTTIPAVWAVLVPVFFYFLVLSISEFYLLKFLHRDITNSVITVLHFIINWISSFITHIAIQQISAIVVSEPRPDFIDRCDPDDDGNCTKDVPGDAYASFFSGHASSAFLSAVHCIVYVLWTAYFRIPASDVQQYISRLTNVTPPVNYRNLKEIRNRRFRMRNELINFILMLIMVIQVSFGWIVGITRITDNRHHIWDVNIGFFVAFVIAFPFSMQAIGSYYKIFQKID